MASVDLSIDAEAAVGRLMRFLAVEGVTGHEKAIGAVVEKALREAGVPRSAIHFDTAHERIPVPTETGNLIVKLPGTPPHPTLSPSGGEGRVRGRLLFSTHLDTVPLCAGAVPMRSKNRITAKGDTALGGDNRTGVACLVTLAATLLERKPPHPPLTLLFTVREESGLFGAPLPRPGRPRRRDDGLQRGRQGAGGPDGRGGRGGSLGGGGRRPGVARRRPPGTGRLGHPGGFDGVGGGGRGTAGSARFGRTAARARPTSASSAAATARAPARRPTSSPITSTSAANRAATTRRSSARSRRPGGRRSRTRRPR